MPVTYVGSGVASSSGAPIGSKTPLEASGVLDGDLVIFLAAQHTNAPNISNTTTILTGQITPGEFYRLSSAIYDGLTSYTISGSGTDALTFSAQIWRGTEQLDVTQATASGNSTNPNPASITPVSNDCGIAIMAVCTTISAGGGNDTTPGTITNYTVDPNGSIAGGDSGIALFAINTAWRVLSGGAGAAEDPAAFSSWTTGDWWVATMALRPGGHPAVKRVSGVKYASRMSARSGAMWRELLVPDKPRLIWV
jgi:hypothetical protein